jgi:hypothetical protein
LQPLEVPEPTIFSSASGRIRRSKLNRTVYAFVLKVREDGRVRNRSAVIATGINGAIAAVNLVDDSCTDVSRLEESMSIAVTQQHATASSIRPGIWRRCGRITALLTLCGLVVLVEWLLGPKFAHHNLFAPFYAYIVLAVWIGDLWEALGAVAAGAVAAAWLMQPLPSWNLTGSVDTDGWLLFVGTALALVGIAHRRHVMSGQGQAVADAPVVSSTLDNPVVVIHGHAQILQGGGIVFDTRATQQAPEGLEIRIEPPSTSRQRE